MRLRFTKNIIHEGRVASHRLLSRASRAPRAETKNALWLQRAGPMPSQNPDLKTAWCVPARGDPIPASAVACVSLRPLATPHHLCCRKLFSATTVKYQEPFLNHVKDRLVIGAYCSSDLFDNETRQKPNQQALPSRDMSTKAAAVHQQALQILSVK